MAAFGLAGGADLASHYEKNVEVTHVEQTPVAEPGQKTTEEVSPEQTDTGREDPLCALDKLAFQRVKFLQEQKRAEFYGETFHPSAELEQANQEFTLLLGEANASEWDFVPRMHVGVNYDAQVESGLAREGFKGEEAKELREFFLALVVAESYDADKDRLMTNESSQGAQGHFQLLPSTAEAIGREINDTRPLNIALHYFSDLYRDYGESPWVAVAGYNSGESKTFLRKIKPAWESMGDNANPNEFLQKLRNKDVPVETRSEVIKVAYILGYLNDGDQLIKDNPDMAEKYAKAIKKYYRVDE